VSDVALETGSSDLQACSALWNWGVFGSPCLPESGGGMWAPWLIRQLIHRLLEFVPVFTPAAAVGGAAGAGALEHPAASSPATASAPAAKHVRIVHPPDVLMRVRGVTFIPVVYSVLYGR
jgi:hypothetical protein